MLRRSVLYERHIQSRTVGPSGRLCPAKNPRGSTAVSLRAPSATGWPHERTRRASTLRIIGLGRSGLATPPRGAEGCGGGGLVVDLCSGTWTAMCSAPLPRAPAGPATRTSVSTRSSRDRGQAGFSTSLAHASLTDHHILPFRLSHLPACFRTAAWQAIRRIER